jgi:dTDP-4-dehydrorhamnose 3,5-epimerase
MPDSPAAAFDGSVRLDAGPQLVPAPRFKDSRGYFIPLASARGLATADETWVQDNISVSRRGVLRGLHFQHPWGQAKLITVVAGDIFDVAFDVRRGSPTFGRAFSFRLDDKAQVQLYVPSGFAHGFYVLSDVATVHYRCSALWNPNSERTILWSDPAVAADWPLVGEPIVSAKDAVGRLLADLSDDELPLWSSLPEKGI